MPVRTMDLVVDLLDDVRRAAETSCVTWLPAGAGRVQRQRPRAWHPTDIVEVRSPGNDLLAFIEI